MVKKYSTFCLILFLLVLAHPGFSQSKRKKPIRKGSIIGRTSPPTSLPGISLVNLPPDKKLRIETFREIWQIVNDYHFDRTFNGLNWRKLKLKSEQRIASFTNDGEFYEFVNELLSKLGTSHFGLIAPDYLERLEEMKEQVEALAEKNDDPDERDGGEIENNRDLDEPPELFVDERNQFGIGVDLKVVGRDAFVLRVEQNSAAARAGLKPGYSLLTVNGISIVDFIKNLETYDQFEDHMKNQVATYLKTVFLTGSRGSTLNVGYDDGSGVVENVLIKRQRLQGEMVRVSPNMPPRYFQFEDRSINTETGYIRFNLFTVQAIEKVCSAITKFRNKKRIIIDLRGNIGGSIGVMWGITGLLIQKRVNLGVGKGVRGTTKHLVEPHKKNFKGEIIILIDSSSMSASEMLAAGLKEAGRVTIVGEKSAGSALPSIIKRLGNGALFQYPISDFRTANGNTIEGRGVKPNKVVLLDKSLLRFDVDTQLNAAISWTNVTKRQAAQKTNVSPLRTVSKGDFVVRKTRRGSAKKRSRRRTRKNYQTKAMSIINRYIALIGGAENLKKLDSLSATGTAKIVQKGTTIYAAFNQYRKKGGVAAEHYYIEGVGNISEYFDGKKFVVQSPFAGTKTVKNKTQLEELKLEKDFLELVNIKQNFSQVFYMGNYKRNGRRVHLIEMKNEDGFGFVFAFDVKTNLLVQRSGSATDKGYGDYRKVGDYLFPFRIEQRGSFSVELATIEINGTIADEKFIPKLRCMDVVE